MVRRHQGQQGLIQMQRIRQDPLGIPGQSHGLSPHILQRDGSILMSSRLTAAAGNQKQTQQQEHLQQFHGFSPLAHRMQQV